MAGLDTVRPSSARARGRSGPPQLWLPVGSIAPDSSSAQVTSRSVDADTSRQQTDSDSLSQHAPASRSPPSPAPSAGRGGGRPSSAERGKGAGSSMWIAKQSDTASSGGSGAANTASSTSTGQARQASLSSSGYQAASSTSTNHNQSPAASLSLQDNSVTAGAAASAAMCGLPAAAVAASGLDDTRTSIRPHTSTRSGGSGDDGLATSSSNGSSNTWAQHLTKSGDSSSSSSRPLSCSRMGNSSGNSTHDWFDSIGPPPECDRNQQQGLEPAALAAPGQRNMAPVAGAASTTDYASSSAASKHSLAVNDTAAEPEVRVQAAARTSSVCSVRGMRRPLGQSTHQASESGGSNGTTDSPRTPGVVDGKAFHSAAFRQPSRPPSWLSCVGSGGSQSVGNQQPELAGNTARGSSTRPAGRVAAQMQPQSLNGFLLDSSSSSSRGRGRRGGSAQQGRGSHIVMADTAAAELPPPSPLLQPYGLPRDFASGRGGKGRGSGRGMADAAASAVASAAAQFDLPVGYSSRGGRGKGLGRGGSAGRFGSQNWRTVYDEHYYGPMQQSSVPAAIVPIHNSLPGRGHGLGRGRQAAAGFTSEGFASAGLSAGAQAFQPGSYQEVADVNHAATKSSRQQHQQQQRQEQQRRGTAHQQDDAAAAATAALAAAASLSDMTVNLRPPGRPRSSGGSDGRHVGNCRNRDAGMSTGRLSNVMQNVSSRGAVGQPPAENPTDNCNSAAITAAGTDCSRGHGEASPDRGGNSRPSSSSRPGSSSSKGIRGGKGGRPISPADAAGTWRPVLPETAAVAAASTADVQVPARADAVGSSAVGNSNSTSSSGSARNLHTQRGHGRGGGRGHDMSSSYAGSRIDSWPSSANATASSNVISPGPSAAEGASILASSLNTAEAAGTDRLAGTPSATAAAGASNLPRLGNAFEAAGAGTLATDECLLADTDSQAGAKAVDTSGPHRSSVSQKDTFIPHTRQDLLRQQHSSDTDKQQQEQDKQPFEVQQQQQQQQQPPARQAVAGNDAQQQHSVEQQQPQPLVDSGQATTTSLADLAAEAPMQAPSAAPEHIPVPAAPPAPAPAPARKQVLLPIAAAPAAAAAAGTGDGAVERITCVVCLEPAVAVAITPCDHHQLCSRCCLRLRLCYKDNKCPLCKTEAKQVVVIATPARGRPVPTFESLMSHKDLLWAKPKWAAGVYARLSDSVPAPGQNRSNRVPLYAKLLQLTAVACPICDKHGQRPFASMKLLQDHAKAAHGLVMCQTCIKAHRKFPLELETYTPGALIQHQKAEHKHCAFCDILFFAVDELWSHMKQQHFHCSICQNTGVDRDLYFKDANGLRNHYAAQHYQCAEGECGEVGMVAFATEPELRDHQLERHSSRMPRFKKNNARHLSLDLAPIIPRHSGQRSGARRQEQLQLPEQLMAANTATTSRQRGAHDSSSSGDLVDASGAGPSNSRRSRAAAAAATEAMRHSSAAGSSNKLQTQQNEWPAVTEAAAGGEGGSEATDPPPPGTSGCSKTKQSGTSSAFPPLSSGAVSRSAGSVGLAAQHSTHAAAGRGSNQSRQAMPSAGTTQSRATGASSTAATAAVVITTAARDPYAAANALDDGGLHIIDDDVGMNYNFAVQQQRSWPTPNGNSNSNNEQSGWPTLSPNCSSSSRAAAAGRGEEFPDLHAAVAAAGGSSTNTNRVSAAAEQGNSSSSGLQLVKATAKCHCGRKQMHMAVRKGETPVVLPCDKECEKQQRKQRLADAFDVESPDQQAAYWDRHRSPMYSPPLLQAYKQDPLFIEYLEDQFISFLAQGPKTPRLTLKPMAKTHRAVVHEYAEQGFGFVTHSIGAEPNRALQVFKTPTSGSPTQLLSQAAVLVSQEAIEKMLQAATANSLTLRLTDISPGANLAFHLREWAGHYRITDDGQTSMLVTFDDPKTYKSCSDALAGGLRGIFRVERVMAGKQGGGSAAAGSSSAFGTGSSGSSSGVTANGSSSSRCNPLGLGQQKSPVAPRAAMAAGTKGGAAAAAEASPAGWQTVRGAKGVSSIATRFQQSVVVPDPWADDDRPIRPSSSTSRGQGPSAAAAVAGQVADDWESALETAVDVPRGPALQLE